jgi:hypothetical protein
VKRCLALILLLAGCSTKPPDWPDPPFKLEVTLARDDKIVCIERIFHVGLPTTGGHWPKVIGYLRREFECTLVPVNYPLRGSEW